jgi:hypothetical protein
MNGGNWLCYLIIFCCVFGFSFCIEFCCCTFSQDPFRGFTSNGGQHIEIDTTNLEKIYIANKLQKLCMENYNGFPSMENIDRLRFYNMETQTEHPKYILAPGDCDKECFALMSLFDEKYNEIQSINRQKKAKQTREKKQKITNILNKKILVNAENFHLGKRSIVKNKFGNNKYNGMIKMNNFKEKSEYADISIDSMDLDDNKKTLETFEGLVDSNSLSCDLGSESNMNEKSGYDLEIEVHSLENEIMYLEKKNKKPIDFILDRFSIPDDILVKLIKIFEESLTEVLRRMRDTYQDKVIFQFIYAGRNSSTDVKSKKV